MSGTPLPPHPLHPLAFTGQQGAAPGARGLETEGFLAGHTGLDCRAPDGGGLCITGLHSTRVTVTPGKKSKAQRDREPRRNQCRWKAQMLVPIRAPCASVWLSWAPGPAQPRPFDSPEQKPQIPPVRVDPLSGAQALLHCSSSQTFFSGSVGRPEPTRACSTSPLPHLASPKSPWLSTAPVCAGGPPLLLWLWRYCQSGSCKIPRFLTRTS